jgi:hypothetical protein
MSDATKGAVSPEAMSVAVQKAAANAGIDWKNVTPTNMQQLMNQAMVLATQANR